MRCDNCPLVKNGDQRDINGNGIGSACDPAEQLALGPGKSYVDMQIRQRLERNQVIELNLVPRIDDPRLCGVARLGCGDPGVGRRRGTVRRRRGG